MADHDQDGSAAGKPLQRAADPDAVVVAFASNPAFRAAEWSELSTPDNPYRRPVRPDDLEWVKFNREMPAEKSMRLSALLGHRMLRNINDLEISLVAPRDDEPIAGDRSSFYSQDNRIRSAMARPVLERHLYSFLDDALEPVSDADELSAWVSKRLAETKDLVAPSVLEQLTGAREATVFALIQYHGFMPAARAALGRAAIGEFPQSADEIGRLLQESYTDWVGRRPDYRALLRYGDLEQTPGAYWQLLLGSSLARGNHLMSLASDAARLPELLGAAWLLNHTGPRDTDAFRRCLPDALGMGADDDALRGLDLGVGWDDTPTLESVVGALITSFGQAALTGFQKGVAHAARLREIWDDDLTLQVSWADKIELHKEYAEKIHRYLEDNRIEVDLDTFVESEEETSTTHVHNEHRLVMVEEGDMRFWNNVTHTIELTAGDKILIPVTRLHGSTVLSGVCTYHQPIISDDLLKNII
ncbi:peptide synthetase [Gordonia hankookensis]|uniref:Peptide synthetase n=1 Tax=Gordonia hankookensis TaxID=589403 RepID=A0ABR7WF59_9ACTN|nr:peptide synthetase [Gordonia hankookensis]MBD1320369.1 peptide synthetase [Gordonia hankookensis]